MWERVRIAGHSADVLTPGQGPYPGAVLYLHGYGGETLAENPVFTECFEKYHLPVVSPVGGACWWLDTLCHEFDVQQTPMQFLRQDVTTWMEGRWGIAAPYIALLGVSMGGQGALNLAYRHARQFPIVASMSPAIDFDQIYGKGFGIEELFPDAEAARQETVVLHLHPLNWPRHQFLCSDPQDFLWHTGSERLASKLMSSGVPFQRDLTTSYGGHGWRYFNAMADRVVRFLAEALQKEHEAV